LLRRVNCQFQRFHQCVSGQHPHCFQFECGSSRVESVQIGSRKAIRDLELTTLICPRDASSTLI
jgi:hypothetical protein